MDSLAPYYPMPMKWSKQDYLEMAALNPVTFTTESCAAYLEDLYKWAGTVFKDNSQVYTIYQVPIYQVLACSPEDVLLYTNSTHAWASKIVAWRLANGR